MNRNPSLFKAVALEDCELLLFRRFRFQQLCREQGKRHMQEAMDHMKEVAQKASKTIAENKPQAFVRSLSVGFNDINGKIDHDYCIDCCFMMKVKVKQHT